MKQIVYVGPTIRGLVKKNQIFTYVPEGIMKEAENVSMYTKFLFLRIDDIVEKRNELRQQGTLLNIAYKNVQEETENV